MAAPLILFSFIFSASSLTSIGPIDVQATLGRIPKIPSKFVWFGFINLSEIKCSFR